MEKLKQLFSAGKPLPALVLLFGIVLTVSGVFNATSTNRIITQTNVTITAYPRLFVGVLMGIIGVATGAVGYSLFHGRLKFKSNHTELC